MSISQSYGTTRIGEVVFPDAAVYGAGYGGGDHKYGYGTRNGLPTDYGTPSRGGKAPASPYAGKTDGQAVRV